MEDRNQVLADFLKDNPKFVAGHYRQLADFHFDVKLRSQVNSGEMSFQTALTAARDYALETLPPPHESLQTTQGLTGYDRSIAELAISRNQAIPPPSNRTEEPLGVVAQICARNAGFKTEED